MVAVVPEFKDRVGDSCESSNSCESGESVESYDSCYFYKLSDSGDSCK